MSYERSKAPLALMEQIVMILVFALAAAVCIQAFVYSDQLSKKGEKRDMAVTKAEQVAEYCKAEQGNLDVVARELNMVRENDGLSSYYPEEDMKLRLQLTESDSYIEKARICVQEGTEELYSVTVAWQKGGAHE